MAIGAANTGSTSVNSGDHLQAALRPGGWGDRIVFGYMFRVVSALAAVITPALIITAWGALNGWRMTTPMLIVYGGIVGFMVLLGEIMRVGVYESRIKPRVTKKDDYAGVTPQLLAQHGPAPLSYTVSKRSLDLALTISGIVAFTPIFVIVSLLIRFDTRGPAIVRYRRIGFNGQEFNLYKFRTLDPSRNSEGTATVTRVGRFLRATSIDELPQLFNVLKGEMSLVGPRPMSVHLIRPNQDTDAPQAIDVAVELMKYTKPGITGVQLRRGAHPNSVLEYVLDRSIMRDFQILANTFVILLRKP